MKVKSWIAMLMFLGAAAAGGYALFALGMNRGMQMGGADGGGTAGPRQAGDIDPANDRKVLYWHDPMVPGQKFDKPGKSPFMDMQLVPVYAGAGGDEGGVVISPRVQQNLGVRTAEVKEGVLEQTVEAVGSVAYNERDVAVVPARTNGYVEKLYVRALLDRVKQGEALAELYAPEWVAGQEEYLTVKRMAQTSADIVPLLEGARQRMRLAGITEDQIRLIESTGEIHPRLTIRAPITGVVTELAAREGMTVMSGEPLFRINGLRTVWVNAEVSEAKAGMVRPGAPVEARAPALPGDVFKGRVSAVLPQVSTATRTLKVRVQLNNPAGRLMPGMFATVHLAPAERKLALLVPSEAVIQTGRRSVVIVARGSGMFEPVDVELGAEANGLREIRKGVEAGEKVVVSGQFLIDSEASLRSTAARMSGVPVAGETEERGEVHRGEGKVESIGNGEITISHGPIPSLKWGAMTMGFELPANAAPKNLHRGDTVAFELHQTKDGTFEIKKISTIAAPVANSASNGGVTGSKK